MRLVCLRQVLVGFAGVFVVNLLLTQVNYRKLITAFTRGRKLYDVSENFHNNRSPLAEFRLHQSARLDGLVLKINLRLQGRFLNPNNTPVVQHAVLDEWERADFAKVLVDVQMSMLKESRGGYHRRIPFPDASRLKMALEVEAVLAYYVETFSNRSCDDGGTTNNGYTLETLVAPQFNTLGNVAELFRRTVTVSDLDFPNCEQAHLSVVHIPRPPEPYVELSWMDEMKQKLIRVQGKEPRPKCFSSSHTFKNFQLRHVPDTMVSILLCY